MYPAKFYFKAIIFHKVIHNSQRIVTYFLHCSKNPNLRNRAEPLFGDVWFTMNYPVVRELFFTPSHYTEKRHSL